MSPCILFFIVSAVVDIHIYKWFTFKPSAANPDLIDVYNFFGSFKIPKNASGDYSQSVPSNIKFIYTITIFVILLLILSPLFSYYVYKHYKSFKSFKSKQQHE